ncbi:MAG: hypothetical protein IJJ15_09185, partial [Ruminococcus sp.]|nr:hypothetical protein [Ruminococcus sp.]
MNKKLMSVVLAIALVITMVAVAIPAVMALGDGVSVTIKPVGTETEFEAGSEVEFEVILGPVEKLQSIEIKLSMPEGLTYKTGSGAETPDAASALSMLSMRSYNDAAMKYGATDFQNSYSSENSLTLFTFTCTIDSGAAPGTEYTVETEILVISDDEGEDFDVNPDYQTIKVKGQPETQPETQP